ncbi:MAG: hypothetical protein J5871_06455 [Bacteroidales bacterium]|nr:hypothetical protein [Bacteroidales bacterium]
MKRILTYSGIVLLLLVIAYAFVPQVLGGKIVNQGDISGWQGMSREMMSWNAAHPHDQTAWTESMFGGMPTTTIHSSTKGDWTQPLYDLLLTGRRPATYLFVSLLGALLLLLAFGVGPWTALLGAIAVTFCSYNIQIIQVGHNTKMQALAFLPWVLAALVFTYHKALQGRKWLPLTVLGAVLFGVALSFQVKANHPQVSYYLALMILLYALALLGSLLVRKDGRRRLGRFFAASALLLSIGLVGIGTNAIKLLPTLEYAPYSMRGGASSSEGKGGLDLGYATAWSYGWEELPNLLIPNYNGGSSSGAVDVRHSETAALLRRAGQQNVGQICRNLPLYWGPQPFTAGPMYLGAVTFLLFLFGLFCYRGRRVKAWVLAVSLLAVLLALGNHFMSFTRFFYTYVPLYNKFRTVSMALVILQFTVPLLGFLMLDTYLRDKQGDARSRRRQVLLAGGVSLGLCLLLALLQDWMGAFTGAVDEGQHELLVEALSEDRRALLWADTWRSVLLMAGTVLLLLWASGPQEGRRKIALAGVGILLVLDFFAVDKRYLGADDFVTPRSFQSQFAKRPVDEAILADTDLSYRVLDLTVNVFNDSHPSYWHKNIGGYSPAKLQRYQEFIENTLQGEIATVSRLLSGVSTVSEAQEALPYLPGLASMNCRYIIVGADNPPLRYRHARGNAWFTDGTGTVELLSYAPNALRYRYEKPEEGVLVFSEVYYPLGWHLTVDGTESLPVAMYAGDAEVPGDLLRCAKVPAGAHELELRFSPPSYARGEAVSRACSLLLLLLLALSAGGAWIWKKKHAYDGE